MKRAIILAVAIAMAVSVAFALDAPERLRLDFLSENSKVSTWVNAAYDTAGTAGWRLVTTGTFTQLSAVDTFRIRSSATTDHRQVRLYYVRSDSSLQSTTLTASGTDTVFARVRGKYFEVAATDTAGPETLTIYGKTSGALATIIPGKTSSEAAHHFFGKNGGGGLYGWGCGIDTTTSPTTGASIRFELRKYNRHLDAINTPEIGYSVVDAVTLPADNTGLRNISRPFKDIYGGPVYCGNGNYVAVYAASATGTTTATRIRAYIAGYDR